MPSRKVKTGKVVPSERAAGEASNEELMSGLGAAGWEGRDVFHIQMAIEEAVVNAIEHGNKKNPAKEVHVVFLVDHDSAEMTVTDQGDGFDHENVADPTEEDRLDQPRGRGVLLIRELMSQAQYNAKGNSVWMRKVRSKDESDAI